VLQDPEAVTADFLEALEPLVSGHDRFALLLLSLLRKPFMQNHVNTMKIGRQRRPEQV
jgi:hypothetical protein